MLLYPPNFSYVEVDKAVGLDSLDSMDGNLDFEMGGLDLKNLGFNNWVLDYLASYVGLPHFSN